MALLIIGLGSQQADLTPKGINRSESSCGTLCFQSWECADRHSTDFGSEQL